MFRILILEDDEMIASGLTYAIEHEGFEAAPARNIKEAEDLLSKTSFDLGILDMQLPDGRGDSIGKKLKEEGVPVIYLTVEDEEAGIVKAFEEGADDYVVKPFRIRELLARVSRTLHRNQGAPDEILRIGSVKIDTSAGKVYAGERYVDLTALEYRILLIFAGNKGKLLTRNQILEKIWDSEGNFVEDNTLTVYIKRIREKLGDSISIETVRGIGYRVG
ncbi:MAG: response regulator transcription factor [Lachnospiraceae bacterium]|nr:response regulator transcription factor [Lachnospiraceae bacterium]